MIIKAGIEYASLLSKIGAESFIESHRASAPSHEINTYVDKIYNVPAIAAEISNPENIYHVIKHNEEIAGFSKMEFNRPHPAITATDISKMDQIYLLKQFYGLKLGAKLLQFNIELSKSSGQRGMWLVVWVHNHQAIDFYKKFGFEVLKDDVFHLTVTHTNQCYIMYLKYCF